jgi:hypothetical protein
LKAITVILMVAALLASATLVSGSTAKPAGQAASSAQTL